MLEVRAGSRIAKLLYLLTVAGEFPMCLISLLGNYQSQMRLIQKATETCEYLNCTTKERCATKVLTVIGCGRQKSLRLLSGAEPILKWLGLWTLFQELHGGFGYSGGREHRDRAQRLSESYVMMFLAGLEINPMQMPKLQFQTMRNLLVDKQCYYGSKQLKEVSILEMNKHMYTRIVGAVFANGNAYAVYNTRDEIMKWKGNGEKKTLVNLEEVSRMNANLHRIKSAILFGKDMDIAVTTLRQKENTKRLEFCFDGIYSHIHFIPMTDNGVRQIRLLLMEDWKEELLSLLFSDSVRSYDKDTLEYDAFIDGKYILSFLDGDIARLQRFRRGIRGREGEYEVLCFSFQVKLLKEYLGELVKIKTVKLEVIENALGLGGEK